MMKMLLSCHGYNCIVVDVELVGLVHEDCHEVDSLALLKNCATTIFHLHTPSNPPAVTASYVHKKKSGKIQKKVRQHNSH